MRLGIIGASGHAKVVCDAALSSGVEVVGFVDEHASSPGTLVGRPVATGIEGLDGVDAYVIAIGDNRTRKARFEHYAGLGMRAAAIVHPSAILADDVVVGAGTVVFAGAVINPSTTIGENVIVNTNASIDHDCDVAAHVHIAPGSSIAGDATVGEGALLGIGSSVVPGTRIGPWSICGAGAAVVRDVDAEATVVGVPARPLEE
jgi:sugar O-acyltransferase (sialic acid O-acetyltransferase NeuD family)